MGNDLVKREEVGLVQFTREELDLLKATVAKGTSDDEFKLFATICSKRHLDPFSGQIRCVVRRVRNKEGGWDRALTVQTGIDGFRALSERSGRYAGMGRTEWCGADGVWKDVWLAEEPPAAARVVVKRLGPHGAIEEIEGIALYREYCQKKDGRPTRFWADMPSNQLAKCAEALARRKAFPEDLGNIYSDEEMGQAETEGPSLPMPKPLATTLPQPESGPEAGDEEDPFGPETDTTVDVEPQPTEAEALPSWKGMILGVLDRKTRSGQPLYVVQCADRVEFTTFSQTLSQEAKILARDRQKAYVEYEENRQGDKIYRNILHLQAC